MESSKFKAKFMFTEKEKKEIEDVTSVLEDVYYILACTDKFIVGNGHCYSEQDIERIIELLRSLIGDGYLIRK